MKTTMRNSEAAAAQDTTLPALPEDAKAYRDNIARLVGEAKRLLIGQNLPTETYCAVENVLRDLGDAAAAEHEHAERYRRLRLLGACIGSGLSKPGDDALYLRGLDAALDRIILLETGGSEGVAKADAGDRDA